MNKYEILEKLISFNTIKDKENSKFISYIENYLNELGFSKIRIIENDKGKCLIAQSSEKCNLCFLGHSDTVDVNDGWTKSPFSLTELNEKLYGLGVCDMKGGIAAFLYSLSTIDISNLKYGIMVIITFDEEIGFEGIKLLTNEVINIPENVLIGEPTDLYPVIACKGCIEYRVEFKGKSVHSSNMVAGDNAILKAINFCDKLNTFYDKLKKETNDLYDIPYTTMNIAIIAGGNAINIVPEKCSLEFDFRTVYKEQHDVINEYINSFASNEVVVTQLNNVFQTQAKNISDINFYEKITEKKGIAYNYVTEGNFLNKDNLIIIGPGPITAHQIDENISVKSFNDTIKIYKEIIQKYCK